MFNLPKIKKKILDFVIEEDAKVIEKSNMKIISLSLFILGNLYFYSKNINAFHLTKKDKWRHEDEEGPSVTQYFYRSGGSVTEKCEVGGSETPFSCTEAPYENCHNFGLITLKRSRPGYGEFTLLPNEICAYHLHHARHSKHGGLFG